MLHKSTAYLALALSLAGLSASVSAKEWYEKGKSCPVTQNGKGSTIYVGGVNGRQHLHIGSGFISIYSDNNKSKIRMGEGVACPALEHALEEVGGGGFPYPADVESCLKAAQKEEDCD